MSIEGDDAKQLAALVQKVENVSERAKEDREVITETRDTAKSIEGKLDVFGKSLDLHAAKFLDVDAKIIAHEGRLSELEKWRNTHRTIWNILSGVTGKLYSIVLALLAAGFGAVVGVLLGSHHVGK